MGYRRIVLHMTREVRLGWPVDLAKVQGASGAVPSLILSQAASRFLRDQAESNSFRMISMNHALRRTTAGTAVQKPFPPESDLGRGRCAPAEGDSVSRRGGQLPARDDREGNICS